MKNKFFLGSLGFLSGFASFYLGAWIDSGPLLRRIFFEYISYIEYVPGLVFGTAISFYFLCYRQPILPRRWLPAWILISTASYYSAVWTVLHLPGDYGPSDSAFSIYLIMGGLVGSFLMLCGFSYFLLRLRMRDFFVLVILGGILGLSWYVVDYLPNQLKNLLALPYLDIDFDDFHLLTLYVIWQGIMAFALGWVADKRDKAATPLSQGVLMGADPISTYPEKNLIFQDVFFEKLSFRTVWSKSLCHRRKI